MVPFISLVTDSGNLTHIWLLKFNMIWSLQSADHSGSRFPYVHEDLSLPDLVPSPTSTQQQKTSPELRVKPIQDIVNTAKDEHGQANHYSPISLKRNTTYLHWDISTYIISASCDCSLCFNLVSHWKVILMDINLVLLLRLKSKGRQKVKGKSNFSTETRNKVSSA